MIKRYLLIFLLLTILLPTTACHSTCKPSDEEFLKTAGLKESDDINQTLVTNYLNRIPATYKVNESIFLDVDARLTVPIIIKKGESFYMYRFDKETCAWVIVKDQVMDFSDNIIIEPDPDTPVIPLGQSGMPEFSKVLETTCNDQIFNESVFGGKRNLDR